MHEDPQQTEPPRLGLGSLALGGGKILTLGTLVERLARLGRNVLLTRIIAPDQFGIMSIVLSAIALFEAITEVGVKQAVIQNKRGYTPEFLNVAWWFSVVRGLFVAALALLLAGPVADFYNEPELKTLLMVAPLTVMFSSFMSPRLYALQRQFRFGPTMWTVQGAGVLGTLFTIGLGLYLQNVWALLWGAVFEAFARLVLSFLLCPMRPHFRLDKRSRQDLFRFSKGMAGLSVLTLLIMQGDIFVLGRVVSKEELGLYTVAIALAAFPLTAFSSIVQPLLVPIFTTCVEDMAKMRSSLLQLSRLVWLFGLPMATVMALTAGPLLNWLYTPLYAAAAPAFAIYSVFTVVYMASNVSFSVYLSIAKPELQRRFTIVRAVLVLLLLYPLAVTLGGTGAALALLLSMLGAMVVQLFNLRRVIGLQLGRYLRTLLAGLLASMIVGVPCFVVSLLPALPDWTRVVIPATVGGAMWVYLLLREHRNVAALRTSPKGTQT